MNELQDQLEEQARRKLDKEVQKYLGDFISNPFFKMISGNEITFYLLEQGDKPEEKIKRIKTQDLRQFLMVPVSGKGELLGHAFSIIEKGSRDLYIKKEVTEFIKKVNSETTPK